MVNLDTSLVKEIIQIGTFSLTAFVGALFTVLVTKKRITRVKQRLAESDQFVADLRTELHQLSEANRRQVLYARAEEVTYCLQYARRLNEIVGPYIPEAEKEEYLYIHTLLDIHNQQLGKQDEETDFVNQYEFSPLVTALNAFCNHYKHERNIYLRVSLLNANSRFTPACQVSFFRMLFEMVRLSVNKTGAADATIHVKQEENEICLQYLDAGVASYPDEFNQAIAITREMTYLDLIQFHELGLTVTFPLRAEIFAEQ